MPSRMPNWKMRANALVVGSRHQSLQDAELQIGPALIRTMRMIAAAS